MAQLTARPLAFFKPDPNQPRKHFDEAALRALGESVKARQNDPVQAKPDGTIIDGERRWRAAMLVGLEELDVIITDAALIDRQINLVRLTSFFHREALSAFEKWSACQQILELNPGWLAKDLAGHLHVDASMITRLLSPSKCIPAWRDALREGKVGISDVYAASKLPESEQAGLLAMKLSGASRDAIEKAGRKTRNGQREVVRLSRVKIAMAQGATVVVSGTALGMTAVVDLLSETLKEARRAADQYDVKTFQSMMKDKAKAAIGKGE
jgi:ParB family transcriptional regulator, chromosome partitioning protein